MHDEDTTELEAASRRKFQRTAPVATDNTGQFRKPSLPASATRQASGTHQRQPSASLDLQRRPSLTNVHKRRTSAVIRDGMRVPSGPRDYPGSPGKKIATSNFSQPSRDAPTSRPSFLPSSSSMPFFGPNLTYDTQNELTRGSFGNPADVSEPTTPGSQRDRHGSGSLDFLPAVNFDEFQTSLGTLDTGSSFRPGLLDEFPAIGGGRVLRSDTTRAKAMATMSVTPGQELDETIGRSSLSSEPSFRQRLADRSSRLLADAKASAEGAKSTKARRQSTVPRYQPQESEPVPRSAQKPSRSNISYNTAQDQPAEVSRSASLVKGRRTTINPTSGTSQDKLRFNGQTTGKQAKGKSLLPSINGSDPNTPTERSAPKNPSSGQTPGSSGNGRRQSIVSGRASGLGARTVSPTDARRAKRMSVASQQPPMPTAVKSPYSPGEPVVVTPEVAPQQGTQPVNKFFEHSRLASAPSPSFLPTRKDSSSLASNSARASPSDSGSTVGRFGFPFPATTSTPVPGGLSSKSSYASLHTAVSSQTPGASQSRVPVPKPRNTQPAASTPSANEDSLDFGELIPPVPAIPKGYESPKDHETSPFAHHISTTATRKASLPYLPSGIDAHTSDEAMPAIRSGDVTRASFDSDRARHGGSRRSIAGPRSIATASVHTQSQPAAAYEASPGGAISAQPRLQPDPHGRQNSNLQPLRLPPLNLVPMSASTSKVASFPRPSQELEERDGNYWTSGMRTPDWSRTGHKTPSTPMTASKATFFRRHGGEAVRSSTSHFGLRDNALLDADAMRTGWLEDSDDAGSNGVPIPAVSRQNFSRATGVSRNTITPFASGSLPKGSGEYARLHARPSGEYTDDAFFLGNSSGSYDGLQLAKAKTAGPRPTIADTAGRSMSIDQLPLTTEADTQLTAIDAADKDTPNGKKEGGLRRKLSLGWRRSGSKAASRAEHHKTDSESARREANSMLPPRLPASITFTGDGSLGISTSARPSLDSGELASLSDRVRRKTEAANKVVPGDDIWHQEATKAHAPPSGLPKTKSIHSERPQPVSNLRASSFGTLDRQGAPPSKSHLTQPRPAKHGHTPSTITALTKDKDDLAADEEMRKLTQKKKDVDNVAKQTEELLQRASPKSPIDLEKILHDRHNSLNIFERGEVVEYETEGVYFTGTKHAKKIVGSLHPSSQPVDAKDDKTSKATNYGYDDERGDYNIVFGDHLAYRYEVCDVLGKGSFGQVVRCIDHKDGGVVAIKIIRNKKRFHQQALVEVGILGKLREWDPDGAHATLSITGSFYFRSHLCIVTPCLSINLYELIRAHNFSGFPLPLIRRFARQLLACLVLLQQKRVIHCDLKPENILLCSARAADVRVIDFGSSCREEEKVYTYIQSRFYRSPEVILGSSYGLGIDMWSFGCILAELWTGYPIFPGENEQDQLACIMEIFGPPDRHLVERCTRKKLFFDSVGKPRVTVSSKGRRRRPSSKTLQQALKTDDEAFVDFVARCLRWDPERRLKPHDACSHAFITNQPFHQRPTIPDEARRAARVRSTAAVPAAGSASPVKRTNPSLSLAATPQRGASNGRSIPDTPQTALRAPAIANTSVAQVSPAKVSANRRQSSVATAGSSAAFSGNRRQSSGAALAASMNLAMAKASGGSLAEKAARESMAATSAANASNASAAGRWRV
ncbi:hypothetical protein AMS68_000977 [Peltaster fructicola]|uniref:Protein kinase domain-containing protein n=1 Tax=Peltaster fructicola TaxID=286661 RepID=A0A6H0XLT1_9PEZI|nr:hypothetical protein AMS68_000977 [Peltaster fructicola]